MKKIIPIFGLTIIIFSLSFQFTDAALVPCGRSADDLYTEINEQALCTSSHFFVLISGAIDFLLKFIIFPLAVLLIAFGGFMYIVGRGEGKVLGVANAKEIITSAVVGLAIILVSWVAINTLFGLLGVQEWTGVMGEKGKITAILEDKIVYTDQTDWKNDQWNAKRVTITSGRAKSISRIILDTVDLFGADYFIVTEQWGPALEEYPSTGDSFTIGGWWQISGEAVCQSPGKKKEEGSCEELYKELRDDPQAYQNAVWACRYKEWSKTEMTTYCPKK